MPILYSVDRLAGTIATTCVGDVTLGEVLEHFEELAASELPERLDVLLDLSQNTSLPETSQIRLVADALAKLRSRTRFDALAIVANTDVLFGMSRMFAVYAEAVFIRTHVFRDRGEAEKWLAEGDLRS